MPIDPNAAVEITGFRWVPDFAKGIVRDMRVRWALEEAGRAYRVRLFDAREPRAGAELQEQPFGQVPAYRDGGVHLFESVSIVLHVGRDCEALLPRDPAARARAVTWAISAVDSVEKAIGPLLEIDAFSRGEAWTEARRPAVETLLRKRLAQLSDWLGDKEHLEGRFTAGDLIMTTALRQLRHRDFVAEHENLGHYLERCEARPAFQRALADHMAGFETARSAA